MIHDLRCRFCEFGSGRAGSALDQPWMQDGDHFALVSQGALVPGWSLVCPREHALNLAQEYVRPGFWKFAARAADAVRARYGAVSVFEHGATHIASTMGCGTDHAHMHLVPLAFSVTRASLAFNPDLRWLKCSSRQIAELVGVNEYLFVADEFRGEETEGMLCVPAQPQSQFFRRVIASSLGVGEEFDYKRYPRATTAMATVADLRTTPSGNEGLTAA